MLNPHRIIRQRVERRQYFNAYFRADRLNFINNGFKILFRDFRVGNNQLIHRIALYIVNHLRLAAHNPNPMQQHARHYAVIKNTIYRQLPLFVFQYIPQYLFSLTLPAENDRMFFILEWRTDQLYVHSFADSESTYY